MSRLLLCSILGFGLTAVPTRGGSPPHTFARQLPAKVEAIPAGKWRVEFTNGVIQTCEIASDGTAKVREPLRTSPGKAVLQDGAVIITFDDNRVERWTQIGKKLVVEHWCPASAYPAERPVLGIAEQSR
jgi:hypothetical protein